MRQRAGIIGWKYLRRVCAPNFSIGVACENRWIKQGAAFTPESKKSAEQIALKLGGTTGIMLVPLGRAFLFAHKT